MRIWSIHPKYLDAAGLVALWREGLLARKALEGKTTGYRNHPQLERFKKHQSPGAAIDAYLHCVCDEAERRGYHFDREKAGCRSECSLLKVTEGQLNYEFAHLKKKLRKRNMGKYKEILSHDIPDPHPVFDVITGGVESWEKV